MRCRALSSIGWILAVTAATLATPALAKDVRVLSLTERTADTPLTPEESGILRRALNFDAVDLATSVPSKSFSAANLTRPRDLDVSRSENPDGSNTVTVVKPLTDDSGTKVGAALDFAAASTTTYEPGKPPPATATDKPCGAAWASLGVTRYATIDARVDAGSEQGTLGATVEHAMPLGHTVSLTLRSHYAVSDTAAAAGDDTAPAPVMSNDQTAQLNIGATGTTLSAGLSATSVDSEIHNTLSAEQKVYGPLYVKTAITDAGLATSNKSVSVAARLTW